MAGGSWSQAPVRAARTIARAATFASNVNVFPALYSCENWHEHSIGHGQWLEGLGLRLLCAQRAQPALRVPMPCLLYTAVKIGIKTQLDVVRRSLFRDLVCAVGSELCKHRYRVFLLYTAVKIGMNVQLYMAKGQRVLLSGSCACSNRAQSVRSVLWEHRYRVSCFIEL